jgi:hypothetical protein
MAHPLLPPAKVAAFSYEIDEAMTLLAHGRYVLRNSRFAVPEEPIVFVCLAGGTEKLLKLTLGILGAETAGSWPDVSSWRHRISSMDEECRRLVRERLHRATHPAFVAQLLDAVEANPITPAVLGVVTTYAVNGRFHNLDTLGGAAPSSPSPKELWDELERTLLVADPELLAQIANPRAGDEALTELCARIDAAIAEWQTLYWRAWQHGVLGAVGRTWSGRLDATPGTGNKCSHVRGSG